MQYPINNKAIYRTWILVVLWVFQLLAETLVIAGNGLKIGGLSYLLANNGSLSSPVCVTNPDTNAVDCTPGRYTIDTTYLGIAIG